MQNYKTLISLSNDLIENFWQVFLKSFFMLQLTKTTSQNQIKIMFNMFFLIGSKNFQGYFFSFSVKLINFCEWQKA